ncbi:alpha/beta fold hydrolase [Microbacterium sp. KUDC0406]|uniref:alpha/beta fold hydrolase n=1 Tax=Microbacterium sp. KUDC0406 TaxID=2909588 RepID=UPI001F44687A|nr:alpha/beta hydrolase [Microbacterium sp. KUDC0406]UJP11257.1 alpha/beta fold hydrolase [Microbacterium sp. KUDC0406]
MLRVGIWDPVGAAAAASVLVIHGVTSSHLAWPFVVEQLPGIRVIAPDLRGRGASNDVEGPAGMSAHADDLVAVLDDLGVDGLPVIGHSMGAFVAVVLAHRHPERVTELLLIDGGLPLDVPAGVEPEVLVQLILGPTAERLSRRWSGVTEYTEEFWRPHPAFAEDWSAELEAYIAYDLVPDGDAYRPATSYRTTVDDTLDMNTGTALPEALAALSKPTLLLTVPRGLQNESPGLYPPAHQRRLLEAFPQVRHVGLDDLNHYTVVMSARGAEALAPHLPRG